VRDLARSNGIGVVRIWNTEKDRRVCQMCADLDGLTDDLWESVYSGDQDISQGAPAHVNCRCDTGLEYVDSITQPAETPAEELTVDDALSIAENTRKLYELTPAEMADQVRAMVPQEVTEQIAALDALKQQQNLYDTDSIYKQLQADHKEAIASGNRALEDELLDKILARSNELYTIMNERYQEIKTLQDSLNIFEDNLYRDVLLQLRHDTPQTIAVNFSPEFSSESQTRIRDLANLVYGTQPFTGVTSLDVVFTQDRCSAWTVMNINDRTPTSTIVHELIHTMQNKYDFGKTESNDFAFERRKGEKLQKLSDIYPATTHFGNNEKAYVDAVDNAYTLKQYDEKEYTNYKYLEVIPMAMTSLSTVNTQKDKELLSVAMQAFKGTR
jgi:hypothetical protein